MTPRCGWCILSHHIHIYPERSASGIPTWLNWTNPPSSVLITIFFFTCFCNNNSFRCICWYSNILLLYCFLRGGLLFECFWRRNQKPLEEPHFHFLCSYLQHIRLLDVYVNHTLLYFKLNNPPQNSVQVYRTLKPV